MDNLFDVLQMVRFNHLAFDSSQVVITDVEGKPNGILTDLFRDVRRYRLKPGYQKG